VLGASIEITSLEAACQQVLALLHAKRGSYVCFATAHMVVESTRNSQVRQAYAEADVIYPDGVPLAWCLRSQGFSEAECVSGPRLFPRLLELAAEMKTAVGFYGGREETLALIRARLQKELPSLNIAYMHSPPFRPLSELEQRADLRRLGEAGTELLFVGLGSPRQELWMHRWASNIPCVSLGVGAAFEFFSGEKILPPLWIQKRGLTWLVRLCQEPRRLMRRNLASPAFVCLVASERIQRMWQGRGVPTAAGASNSGVDDDLSRPNRESASMPAGGKQSREEANDVEICL